MKTSETIKEISAAFAKAQGAFARIEKSANNPFFRSKYATLDLILDAVRPALSVNGLHFSQDSERTDGGIRVTSRLGHASGEWIESSIELPHIAKKSDRTGHVADSRTDPQTFGSLVSYARRYGALLLLGVAPADEDDDDCNKGAAPSRSGLAALAQQKAEPPSPISDEERAKRLELSEKLKAKWSEAQTTRATVVVALRAAASKVQQPLAVIPTLSDKRIDLLEISSEILGAVLSGEEQPS